jgi:alpha-1,4-digalacturonate transport system substrate-binding protein
MKRFTLLFLSLLLIGSGVLFANGQKEGSGQAVSQQKELTALWFYDDPAELDFLNKKVAEYSATHPGVSIKVNTVAYDDLFPRVAQLVAAGTPPDIVKLTDIRPEIAPFVQDLSQYLGKDFLKPFIPGLQSAMTRDSQIVGAPLDVTANGIILNKTLFEKAGVAIPSKNKPWTWDQFLVAAGQVKQKTGVLYSLVWDVTPHRWSTYLFQNGGSYYDSTGTKANFNTPEAIQALRGFDKMFDDGYIPKSIWIGAENPRDMFFSGNSVAWMSGSWQVKAMIQNLKDFQWTAGPNPYVTTRSSVLGYKFVSAFSTAKHPDVAADFIKFFTSKEVNSEYAKALLTISARTDTGTIDYQNPQATEALNNLAYELAVSPLAASKDVTNPAMGFIWNTVKENVMLVLTKEKTPEQAAADVNAKITEALAAVKGK